MTPGSHDHPHNSPIQQSGHQGNNIYLQVLLAALIETYWPGFIGIPVLLVQTMPGVLTLAERNSPRYQAFEAVRTLVVTGLGMAGGIAALVSKRLHAGQLTSRITAVELNMPVHSGDRLTIRLTRAAGDRLHAARDITLTMLKRFITQAALERARPISEVAPTMTLPRRGSLSLLQLPGNLTPRNEKLRQAQLRYRRTDRNTDPAAR